MSNDSFGLPMDGDEDEFARLFAASGQAPRPSLRPGDRVRGRVAHVGEQHAVIDLGQGREALVDLAELKDRQGRLTAGPGDEFAGYVVRLRDRIVEVARAMRGEAGDLDALAQAHQAGVPVEAVVVGVNKGGFELDVGGVRGFCPLGQFDLRRVEQPQAMVGQRHRFRVTEVRGREVVLSRRQVLEEEAARTAAQTLARLEVGARLSGTVTNVRDFGAFVDLGGIEGLVPASELAWGRQAPQQVVELGQAVDVEVQRIEPAPDGKGLRISLSMRKLSADPFEACVAAELTGTVLRGTVRRVEPFGAFVELVPGVEGLVHVSAFGRRVRSPSELARVGVEALVRVDKVDPAARRISLGWVDADRLEEVLEGQRGDVVGAAGLRIVGKARRVEPVSEQRAAASPAVALPEMAPPPRTGAVVEVTVDRVEPFGVFVGWPGGRGLVPAGELGLPYGADLRRSVPVGTTFEAAVVEVRADGKVRLSRTAAQQARERAAADEWLAAQQPSAGSSDGVGSFGALLRDKLSHAGAGPRSRG